SFVLAKTEWFSPIIHVDVGEVLGLLGALTWVQEFQLGTVDFELDSKTVVTKFHSPRELMCKRWETLLEIVGVFITLILATLGWSLSGDKLMRLFMLLQG
ncbi:cytochrome P450, partial [Trifolium medium]|nr:cytochrome P450 [Trifolium medium]